MQAHVEDALFEGYDVVFRQRAVDICVAVAGRLEKAADLVDRSHDGGEAGEAQRWVKRGGYSWEARWLYIVNGFRNN